MNKVERSFDLLMYPQAAQLFQSLAVWSPVYVTHSIAYCTRPRVVNLHNLHDEVPSPYDGDQEELRLLNVTSGPGVAQFVL